MTCHMSVTITLGSAMSRLERKPSGFSMSPAERSAQLMMPPRSSYIQRQMTPTATVISGCDRNTLVR
jgi:hypothetical protein